MESKPVIDENYEFKCLSYIPLLVEQGDADAFYALEKIALTLCDRFKLDKSVINLLCKIIAANPSVVSKLPADVKKHVLWSVIEQDPSLIDSVLRVTQSCAPELSSSLIDHVEDVTGVMHPHLYRLVDQATSY